MPSGRTSRFGNRDLRLAVTSSYLHIVGGAEVYLRNILPLFSARKWNVQLWHEYDPPPEAELLPIPASNVRSVSASGIERARREIEDWQPDLIYDHGVESTEWEAMLPDIAPVVHFEHAYHGTCISGDKAWHFPTERPCSRRFSPLCLMHYFPHRCGGLSPVTMIRQYRVQAQRLRTMQRFAHILTASEHMRMEMLNHDISPERVTCTGLYLVDDGASIRAGRQPELHDPVRLLYCGRIVAQKGGRYLIEAADIVARRSGRNVSVTFAGSGPDYSEWQARAASCQSGNPLVQYVFASWVNRERLQEYYATHDIVVVPSIWPEPFGMVCVEALQHGIPVVAFDVGGIGDTITDGVNGHLAPASPPTAAGLADAIARCVQSSRHYADLCSGAHRSASENRAARHLDHLTRIFESLCARERANMVQSF